MVREKRIGQTVIRVLEGDLTEQIVEAVVNAANNKLIMGGGVGGALKRRGGREIEDEAVAKGPIAVGEAITTGAGRLPAQYVIHAAVMGLDFKTDAQKIRTALVRTLKLAEEMSISTLALPALGTGVGRFSIASAAEVMLSTTAEHVRERTSSLREVIFCLFGPEAYQVFSQALA